MIKTIGDLTLNQVKEIKSRCSNYETCEECEKKIRYALWYVILLIL